MGGGKYKKEPHSSQKSCAEIALVPELGIAHPPIRPRTDPRHRARTQAGASGRVLRPDWRRAVAETSLTVMAKNMHSSRDSRVFASELSVALSLCFLPAILAGIGANVISHILIRHLDHTERRLDREHG